MCKCCQDKAEGRDAVGEADDSGDARPEASAFGLLTLGFLVLGFGLVVWHLFTLWRWPNLN